MKKAFHHLRGIIAFLACISLVSTFCFYIIKARKENVARTTPVLMDSFQAGGETYYLFSREGRVLAVHNHTMDSMAAAHFKALK